MMEKEEIRKRLIAQRKTLSQAEVLEKSEKISRAIRKLDAFLKAKTVLFYVSKDQEVHTHTLLRECLAEGEKVVCVPYVANQELCISKVEDFAELQAGAFGVLEPSRIRTMLTRDVDLILVPGIAFDRQGYRIGYGLGYYDILLKEMRAEKLGLAYQFQLVKKIPVETHDVKMDLVVTERGVVKKAM